VEASPSRIVGRVLAAGACVACAVFAAAQQVPVETSIPANFNLDMKTAARLRPQLAAASVTPPGRYAAGQAALEKLVKQARPPEGVKIAWELRITNEDLLNAYSSPDGTIYVGRGLARLAGSSAGLWAAILSHEIAHVVRRDWAQRYLYEQSLRLGGATSFVLGDPGQLSGAWTEPRAAGEELGEFCRRLELQADRMGLMLMARAGYHPDFVPALHHLLHARGSESTASAAAMHPCWETRDRELERAYLAAWLEYDRYWPDLHDSPGGVPPVVVFEDEPTVRKHGAGEWQIQVPLRCRNLAGAVEVVLERRTAAERLDSGAAGAGGDVRQLTGCTSPKTTVTFTVTEPQSEKKLGQLWTDVYVLDDEGSVLARAEIPGGKR